MKEFVIYTGEKLIQIYAYEFCHNEGNLTFFIRNEKGDLEVKAIFKTWQFVQDVTKLEKEDEKNG